MKRPRAWAKPAAKPAVWPKLRRKRMTRSRASRACSAGQQLERLIRAAVVDHDDLVAAAEALERRRSAPRTEAGTFGASLRTGMTTEISGFIVSGVTTND